MKRGMEQNVVLGLWALIGFALGSCGGGTGKNCGPGTVAQGDQCVLSCAQGQYWDGQACKNIPACATGTTWNATTNQCEPDIDRCATGTQLIDGECVSDISCGPNTHLQNGQCVPNTLPAAQVEEAPEPNDFLFPGSIFALFVLPEIGQSITLGGVIDPPEDLNGDGFVEADWDSFGFAASAGTYLRVSATSQGPLMPAFGVLGIDDLGYIFYERYAVNPDGADSQREVYLPSDGTYFIQVSDYSHVVAKVLQFGFFPVGGNDFRYLVTVERLGAPQLTEVDALPFSDAGDFNQGKLHFYHFTGLSAGEVVGSSSVAQGQLSNPTADTLPVLMAFGATGQLLQQQTAENTFTDLDLMFAARTDGDYLLVQDFLIALGPNRQFELEAKQKQVQDCPSAGTVCENGTTPQGEDVLLRWQAPPQSFDLFAVSVVSDPQSSAALMVTLLDEDLNPTMEAQAYSGEGMGPATVYGYSVLGGAQVLSLREWSNNAVSYHVEVVQSTPPELQSGTAVTGIPVIDLPQGALQGDVALAHFSASAGQVAVFTHFLAHDPARLWGTPQEEIYDASFNRLGPASQVQEGQDLIMLQPPLAYIPQDGTYLHLVWDRNPSADILGGSYDVTLQLQAVLDLGAPTFYKPAQVADQKLYPDTGLAIYSFEAQKGDPLTIDVVPSAQAGIKPEIWVLAFGSAECNWGVGCFAQWGILVPSLLQATSAVSGHSGQSVELTYLAPYSGKSFLLVRDANSQALPDDSFAVSISALPRVALEGADACANTQAVDLTLGRFVIEGTTRGADNSATPLTCTGDYLAMGPEVFYRLDLNPGDNITLTLNADFAPSLYLFDDCDDIDAGCVGGQPIQPAGQFLTFANLSGSAQSYLLAVDSYVYESGPFLLVVDYQPVKGP